MKWLKKQLFYLFFFGYQILISQNVMTLNKFVEFLSKNYNIAFSYNAQEIDGTIVLDFPTLELENLDKALNIIKFKTNYKLQKIDSSNYIILKKITSIPKYLCGRIVSTYNNPISSAVIKMGDKITKTDLDGYFYLENPNKKLLVTIEDFRFNLKQIYSTKFNFELCKTIILQQNKIELDETIIKSYITKGLSKKDNGSIAIEIQKTGILPGVIEPDAIQSLQFIPGLQSPNETTTGLHIRGSTPDQNLVLFDNVKMYHSSHFFGLISAFNPYVVNNIQLFRSGTKARYGGHAGGVISLGVDNSIDNKTKVGINATFTHISSDVKIPVVKNKLAILASARRGVTDFLNTITFQQYSEVAFQNTDVSNSQNITSEPLKTDSFFLYQDYFAKLIFKPIPSLKFNLGYIANQNNLSFSGLNPFVETETNDNLKERSTSAYVNFSYQNKKLGTHTVQVNNTHFNKRFKGLSDFNFSSQQPTLLEITFDKENYVNETTIQYHGTKDISKMSSLHVGYQRSRSKIAYTADSYGLDLRTFKESFKGEETSQSFNAEFIYKNPKVNLNIGVRRQYFNRLHDIFWEPRFFLNYKLLSSLWFRGSYEIKHQSISQVTDLRNDGLGDLFNRLWVVSTDQSIPLLTNHQIGFGLDFQKKGWTFDFEIYSKQLNGIGILLNDNIFDPKNVSGSSKVNGIDILLKRNWKHYSTWVSYSYTNNKYQFKEINNNNPFKGSFDIPHSLIWTHSLKLNNFSLSLGYRFRNGIPYTEKKININNPESNFLVFEDFNKKRLPNYQRLDLTASYSFKSGKEKKINTTIGFTIQNIINSKNILSRDFRVQEAFDPSGNTQLNKPILTKIDRVSLGFTPNLMLRVAL